MWDCLLNAVLLEITEITLRGEVNTEEKMRIPPFLKGNIHQKKSEISKGLGGLEKRGVEMGYKWWIKR